MAGKLTIEKLSAICIVADSPHAASIADRATRALRDEFPDTARRALAAWLDRPDESVWLVRRLDLAVMTAADVPADALAASVVMALGRALGESLSGEGDGANVIRFENRAAYLGQFVTDLAAGDAWSRWYYGPFMGLRALPTSTAIRTALIERPETGLAALVALEPPALMCVSQALAPADEDRVLVAFEGITTSEDPGEQAIEMAAVACVRAWQHSPARGFAMRALAHSGGATPLRERVRATRIVANAIQPLHDATGLRPDALLRVLDRTDGHAHLPQPIAGAISPRLMRRLADLVVTAHGSPQFAGDSNFTRVGGLCLLLRDLDDLPWDSWTADFPAPPAGTASAVLRWLALVLCAGRKWGAHAFHDAAMRSLFGLPRGSIDHLLAWLRALDSSHFVGHDRPLTAAERKWLVLERRSGVSRRWCRALAPVAAGVIGRFARRIPGFSGATPDYLWRNFLAFNAVFEPEADRIIVKCDRPPLHVLLTLTGMLRGLCAGHDCEDRPVLIFPRD